MRAADKAGVWGRVGDRGKGNSQTFRAGPAGQPPLGNVRLAAVNGAWVVHDCPPEDLFVLPVLRSAKSLLSTASIAITPRLYRIFQIIFYPLFSYVEMVTALFLHSKFDSVRVSEIQRRFTEFYFFISCCIDWNSVDFYWISETFTYSNLVCPKNIEPRVVVQWLAHAPLIREVRVRFSPKAGHLGKVFSGFPSPSRWILGWYLYKSATPYTFLLPILRFHLALHLSLLCSPHSR